MSVQIVIAGCKDVDDFFKLSEAEQLTHMPLLGFVLWR